MTPFYRNFIAISFLVLLLTNLYAQNDNRIRLAQALERSREYEQALELYQEIFNSGQHGFTIILGIQKSYTALNRYPELVEFMRELIRLQPDNLNHEINLGKAYYLNQQKEKAMAQWNESIRKRPKDISAYRLTARNMSELRLLDEAIEVYASAIKNTKNQQSLYREMAHIRRAQLDYEQATEFLLKYYLSNKGQKNYVRSQFIAMAKDDKAATRIATVIQKFLNKYPTDTAIQEYQATLHIRLKQFSDAFQIYQNLNNINLFTQFAEEARKGGAFSLAIAAYEKVLMVKQNETRHNALRLKKAQVYLNWANQFSIPVERIKKIESAQQILLPISTQNPDPANRWRALELLGDIHNDYLHQPLDALELYKKVAQQTKVSPLHDRVQFKIAEIYLRQNALQKASIALEHINGKQKARAHYELALLDYYQGRFDSATQQLKQIQKKMVTGDTLLNNILSRLNHIQEFQSDSSTLTLYARAELLQRQKNLALAAAAYKKIFETDLSLSGNAALQAAKLYQQLDQPIEAKELLEQTLQRKADFIYLDRVYFQLAGIMEEQNQTDRALEYYLKLITSNPQSFLLDRARERARLLQTEDTLSKQ